MLKSPIVTPTPIKGWVSRNFDKGTSSYDLDGLCSPDTVCAQSRVLDLVSPKFTPNNTYWFDKSKYNNHGTITGAVWQRLPSGVWVMRLDGVDDKVDCGNPASLNSLTGVQTHMAWMKANSLGENNGGRILDKSKIAFATLGTNQIDFAITVGAVGKYARSAANTLVFGSWFCVFGIYDGTNVLLDVNGTTVTGSATAGPVDDHSASSFLIGDVAGSNRCFDGVIGNVRSWNRALTQAERNDIRLATQWRYQ
jgi:hypothetical protein